MPGVVKISQLSEVSLTFVDDDNILYTSVSVKSQPDWNQVSQRKRNGFDISLLEVEEIVAVPIEEGLIQRQMTSVLEWTKIVLTGITLWYKLLPRNRHIVKNMTKNKMYFLYRISLYIQKV